MSATESDVVWRHESDAMTTRLIECVPNISEGRDRAKAKALHEANAGLKAELTEVRTANDELRRELRSTQAQLGQRRAAARAAQHAGAAAGAAGGAAGLRAQELYRRLLRLH